METFVFAVIFVVTIGSACLVAFSRNLIYSAFALIGTFMGVAGTFVMLHASFLGLAQVVVYAGGILVLTIFAVMLTAKIESQRGSNPLLNYKAVFPLMLVLIFMLWKVVATDKWAVQFGDVPEKSMIADMGLALLNDYLLPFELISVVLLVSMVAAAIITRRHVRGGGS